MERKQNGKIEKTAPKIFHC